MKGRFAPSPSGRVHLGNLFSMLLAWLDARSVGGRVLLRMEDLDPERCRESYAHQLADDLRWLGLDWDEGYGIGGPAGPYRQSQRSAQYETVLGTLAERGLLYPCWCTRAERMAAGAPHPDEKRRGHACPCRSFSEAKRREMTAVRPPLWRCAVPDQIVSFTDGHYGLQSANLACDIGDPILRRSDGVFAYQLAVTADDGAMGVTRVVRGRDLLPSTPLQIWLLRQIGRPVPAYFHVPLLTMPDGRRLSKRERDLDMSALQSSYGTPQQLLGLLGWLADLLPKPEPVTLAELLNLFSWSRVPKTDVIMDKEWVDKITKRR
ncbi:MAG: tRNA glutamyl-Q(34) synthetase GluQRS [Intestinimonas sp.]|nr:tRNA glutamyl-Q(34) synthetase GluQRS [Intestinimonas sp.]